MSVSERDILTAVAILKQGGVVGLPTETVYGLAADARDSAAVSRVFSLKGRPATNPLIVHVASVEMGSRYAAVDERARRLFDRFAPGPLTIVLPMREGISPLVSAGLSTVGIRIPNHPVAIQLLEAFDGPLAAPSANRSNRVSPTTAAHVAAEFGEAVFTLDGGACTVGVESTVLSLATPTPLMLRPGAITRAQLESVLGPVDQFEGHVSAHHAAASPGQHEKHYAPVAPAFRFDESDRETLQVSQGDIVLSLSQAVMGGAQVLEVGPTPERMMNRLYAALREADAQMPSRILVEMPPDTPAWAAVRDRVRRATRPISEATAPSRPSSDR